MATVIVNQAWIDANQSQGALFFNVAGNTYQFAVDFSAAGSAVFVMADNITIDLNGYTITYNTSGRAGTIGINAFGTRSAFEWGTDDANFSGTAGGGSGADGLLVKNGRVITNTSGDFATAIGGVYSSGTFSIDNCYLKAAGMDGHVARSNWSNISITNTYGLNTSTTTYNRHMLPGNVKTTGAVTAYNNILIGGNSGIVPGNGSRIYDNVIRQSGFATNGYSVNTYENSDVRAYNNLMVPTNGRGFMDSTGVSNQCYENVIVVHEAPNAEFGNELNAPCLRARYDTNGLIFRDNTCLGIGGGGNCATSGAYMGGVSGKVSSVYDNEFRVILGTVSRSNQYANGITFEGHGASGAFCSDYIERNIFRSNNYLYRLCGFDGSCYQNQVRDNELYWVGGDATYTWIVQAIEAAQYLYTYPGGNTYVTSAELASIKATVETELQGLLSGQPDNRSRRTIFGGYYNYDSYITILDSVLGTGVALEAADVYLEGTSYAYTFNTKIGHSLHVICRGGGGVLLTGRTITVADNTGTTWSGTTNASGYAKLELIDYVLARSGSSVVKTSRTDHAATIATVGTASLPQALRNTESTPYTLNFGGAPVGTVVLSVT